VDASGIVRNWFRTWTRIVVNTDSSGSNRKGLRGADPYEFGYKEDYQVDIRVTMFDDEGNPCIVTVLHEAWPNFIGDNMIDWHSNNTLMNLTVIFTYKDWSEELVGDNFATTSDPSVSSGLKAGGETVTAPESNEPVRAQPDTPTRTAEDKPRFITDDLPPKKPIILYDYDLAARIGPQRWPGTEGIDYEKPKRTPVEPKKKFK
jgi:hypothetical protein